MIEPAGLTFQALNQLVSKLEAETSDRDHYTLVCDPKAVAIYEAIGKHWELRLNGWSRWSSLKWLRRKLKVIGNTTYETLVQPHPAFPA